MAMAADQQDPSRHAGHVVRRVLLRRNIAIDAETAQLVAAAVQAALRSRCALPAAAPGLACSRRRLRAAVLTWHQNKRCGPISGTVCGQSGGPIGHA